MTPDTLNYKLQRLDIGDDWLEKNWFFDTDFTSLTNDQFVLMRSYANNQMNWYWTNQDKHYLLAECNRFHFMWLGYAQVWCTQHGIKNPAIGRAYGYWEGLNHMWAYVVVENEIVFINWGQEVKPANVRYDGKGSMSV